MKTRLALLALWALTAAACAQGSVEPPADVGVAPADAGAAPAAEPAPTAPGLAEPWASQPDLIQAPARAEPKALQVPALERFALPNGLQVRIMREASLPLVHLRLLVPASTDQEPRELRALAQFAASMLTQGTKSRSAEQIAATIDQVGGSLSASADPDGTMVTCEVLTKDLGTCLELLPDVILRASFPESEMGQVRDQLLAGIKQVRDTPQLLVKEHFANLLWGEDHVRGWPQTAKTVGAITRKDLVTWHAERFQPMGSILFVAGDVNPTELKPLLEKAFGGWPKAGVPPPRAFPEPSLKGLTIRLVDKPDLTQTQIMIGHPGLAAADPDFLATTLFNYSLGAGAFSSRLMKVVRSEGGKTYHASSHFDAGRERGPFWAYTFTNNAQVVATLKLVLDELEKMRREGPTPAELEDAKSNLAGNHPLHLESPFALADALLGAEVEGLDADYVRDFPLRVNAVGLDEVKSAAARRLDPGNAVVVLVSKAEELEPLLKAAGYTWEKVGYLEPTSARERAAAKADLATPLDPAKVEAGRKLLDEALAAKGGLDKLRAVKDIQLKGTGKLSAQGQTFDVQVSGYFGVPDRKRLDLTLPMGTITTVVTPEAAWGGMGAMTRDAPPELVAKEQAQMWRHKDLVLLRHLEPGVVVVAREPVEEGGVRYDVVELRKADGSLRTALWLDPKTRMLARLVYDQDGEQAVEKYSDYRPVAGLQMSFAQQQTGPSGQVELTLSEVKVNAGLPAGLFDRPKAPEPAPAPAPDPKP
jgi:zinc protease